MLIDVTNGNASSINYTTRCRRDDRHLAALRAVMFNKKAFTI